MKTIGIFIFNDAEELDFVGPYEVFTMINTILQYLKKPDAVKVILISEDGNDITGKKGMRVGAHAAMGDIDKLDVICIPGGDGARAQIKNEAVINWVKTIAPTCEWVTSVCTGSFILAKRCRLIGEHLKSLSSSALKVNCFHMFAMYVTETL